MWTRESLTKSRVNNPRLRFIVNIETELTPSLTTVIKYPLTVVLLGSIPIVLRILASTLQQQYNQAACATVRTVDSYFLAHFTYDLKHQDSNVTTIVRYEVLMMGEFIRLSCWFWQRVADSLVGNLILNTGSVCAPKGRIPPTRLYHVS